MLCPCGLIKEDKDRRAGKTVGNKICVFKCGFYLPFCLVEMRLVVTSTCFLISVVCIVFIITVVAVIVVVIVMVVVVVITFLLRIL